MCVESSCVLAEKHGGTAGYFDTVMLVQKKAFLGHLKCIISLNKDWPHNKFYTIDKFGIISGEGRGNSLGSESEVYIWTLYAGNSLSHGRNLAGAN